MTVTTAPRANDPCTFVQTPISTTIATSAARCPARAERRSTSSAAKQTKPSSSGRSTARARRASLHQDDRDRVLVDDAPAALRRAHGDRIGGSHEHRADAAARHDVFPARMRADDRAVVVEHRGYVREETAVDEHRSPRRELDEPAAPVVLIERSRPGRQCAERRARIAALVDVRVRKADPDRERYG